jgi:hypothetical protein
VYDTHKDTWSAVEISSDFPSRAGQLCTKIDENTLYLLGGSNGKTVYKDSFYLKLKGTASEFNKGPDANVERCWSSNGISFNKDNNKLYTITGFGSNAEREEMELSAGIWVNKGSKEFEVVAKQMFESMGEKIDSVQLDLTFNTVVVLHKA